LANAAGVIGARLASAAPWRIAREQHRFGEPVSILAISAVRRATAVSAAVMRRRNGGARFASRGGAAISARPARGAPVSLLPSERSVLLLCSERAPRFAQHQPAIVVEIAVEGRDLAVRHPAAADRRRPRSSIGRANENHRPG